MRAVKKPGLCSFAPSRWYQIIFSDRYVPVRYELAVKHVVAGKSASKIIVVQDEWVDFQGCHASSESACQITAKKTEDLWILSRAKDGTYRRANLCTTSLIVEAWSRKTR